MPDNFARMHEHSQRVIAALVEEGKDVPYWATRQLELVEVMVELHAKGLNTNYALNDLIAFVEEHKAEIERDTSLPYLPLPE